MAAGSSQQRRVVVTGLGIISPVGTGKKVFWNNLIQGKSGIDDISSFDPTPYKRSKAGEVTDFDPVQYMHPKKAKLFGRSSQFGIAAVRLTLEDAGFTVRPDNHHDIALCCGMTMAEPLLLEDYHEGTLLEKKGWSYRNLATLYPASSIVANISNEFDLRHSAMIFSTACAAGNYSIGHAFDMIRAGRAKYAVAGGVDSFSRSLYSGFMQLLAIAPEKCQPFDVNRKGMIPAEGAGFLFLETLQSAQERGADIYAEVKGYGLSCDAEHMTTPSVGGISKAIENAIKDADVTPDQIDYVCAHGTGTLGNDATECQAIHKVMGRAMEHIPVSSIKSSLGHTMGAASGIESAACCLAIRNNMMPPTINTVEVDPQCNVDCVPGQGRAKELKTVLNNASAFGGNNACVVFSEV